jgi:peptidylglycine monooxygenase
MSRHELVVALGSLRYRVERPFGAWPANAGRVSDVTVGPSGNVHVMLRHDPCVDPAHPRVIVLSPEGDYLSAWGGAEIADSHSLTATADSRIFAVDRDMHEVIMFSADGRRLGGIGRRGHPHQPFNHPTDVALAPSGDIYVSDGYAGWSIHRFAGDGTHRQTWGALGSGPGQFLEPHSLWCLSDGRVVVADRCNHRLQVFDTNGAYVTEWGGFRRPVAIWGDSQDRLFVTDEVPSLHCLRSDGSRLGRARPVLNGAHGIYGTNDGVIYLAETNPSRITRLVPLSA